MARSNVVSLTPASGGSTRPLDLATGNTVTSNRVTNSKTTWADFLDRLQDPVITDETYAEYLAMSPDRQDSIKDVGYFVFGHYRNDVRKKQNLTYRDAIVLDLDHMDADWEFDLQLAFHGLEYAVYSTHKHCAEKPRLRQVFPLARKVNAEEYEAIARKLADRYDIEAYDKTTFQFNRVMHWPSHSIDADYVYLHEKGEWADPTKILSEYNDYRDMSEWPRHADTPDFRPSTERAEDPRSKSGWVGAFCRSFTISEAMDEFLPNVYTHETGDRYSYSNGTTSNGAVVYDNDTFLYSHHESDPCGGRLVNAFDMVRLHLFGDLDKKAKDDTPAHKLPSYRALVQTLDSEDDDYANVREELVRANTAQVANEFDDLDDMSDLLGYPDEDDEPDGQAGSQAGSQAGRQDRSQVSKPSQDAKSRRSLRNQGDPSIFASSKSVPSCRIKGYAAPANWANELAVDQHGNFKKTLKNIALILRYDSVWGHNIRLNEFTKAYVVSRPTPSHQIRGEDERVNGSTFTEKDISQIKYHLETVYGMANVAKEAVFDAVRVVAEEFSFHPVLHYLESLPAWDGVPRLDTMLIDYLGAPDSKYVRAATRKTLCGAINRVYNPGSKFDTMLVLEGLQGIGKGLFLKILSKNPSWFREGVGRDLGMKTAAENMAGAWIIELPEGEGIVERSNVDDIKAFLTRSVDTFRPAYGIQTQTFPRQSIFIMTTNRDQYLMDDTGHRRFWPVKCHVRKVDVDTLSKNIDQIWAEALMRWSNAEKLWLDDSRIEDEAKTEQRMREVDDGLTGRIEEWLNTPITAEFEDEDGDLDLDMKPVYRTETCVRQVWSLCFGEPESKLTRVWSNRISAALKKIDGWEYRPDKIRTFDGFGRQRAFIKSGSDSDD